MNTVIIVGSRVRVTHHKKDYQKEVFTGTCKGWTDGGRCRVQKDGETKAKAYNSDDVKLIK